MEEVSAALRPTGVSDSSVVVQGGRLVHKGSCQARIVNYSETETLLLERLVGLGGGF